MSDDEQKTTANSYVVVPASPHKPSHLLRSSSSMAHDLSRADADGSESPAEDGGSGSSAQSDDSVQDGDSISATDASTLALNAQMELYAFSVHDGLKPVFQTMVQALALLRGDLNKINRGLEKVRTEGEKTNKRLKDVRTEGEKTNKRLKDVRTSVTRLQRDVTGTRKDVGDIKQAVGRIKNDVCDVKKDVGRIKHMSFLRK